jgi:hypothetical protein
MGSERHSLENAAATLLVSSAACGSGLLALDAASALRIQTRIILPFAPDAFRETSVVDRPSPVVSTTDSLRRRVSAAISLFSISIVTIRAYAAANQAIIDEALRAAHEGGTAASAHSRGRVWEGAARNGDDATDHFRRI